MMKFFKGLLSSISAGITIGLLLSLFFSYCYQLNVMQPSGNRFVDSFSSPLQAMAVATLIWAGMGAMFYLASFIYRIESISITKQTTYHFLVTYVGYTVLALFAKWYPFTATWFLIYTAIYILIYIIIWFCSMQSAKHLVEEVNALALK